MSRGLLPRNASVVQHMLVHVDMRPITLIARLIPLAGQPSRLIARASHSFAWCFLCSKKEKEKREGKEYLGRKRSLGRWPEHLRAFITALCDFRRKQGTSAHCLPTNFLRYAAVAKSRRLRRTSRPKKKSIQEVTKLGGRWRMNL